MNHLTRTAIPAVLLALCSLPVLADCDGQTGSLMSIPASVAGTENLSPALAELIAHHRGELVGTEVSETRQAKPQARIAPAYAALPPNTRVALAAPVTPQH